MFGMFFQMPHVFAQAKDAWPIYRGDSGLHGITSVDIPDAPKVLWISKMASGTKSSSVIADEKIFIGSEDGTLYCLDFEGKVIWKLETKNTIRIFSLSATILIRRFALCTMAKIIR